MKLPEEVKVACFNIEIKHWDTKTATVRHCFGEFSPDELIIRIDTTQKPQRIIETLIHEITHAIYSLYNVKDEDKEERIVSSMSRGWLQVYQDNPEIMSLLHSHTNTQKHLL